MGVKRKGAAFSVLLTPWVSSKSPGSLQRLSYGSGSEAQQARRPGPLPLLPSPPRALGPIHTRLTALGDEGAQGLAHSDPQVWALTDGRAQCPRQPFEGGGHVRGLRAEPRQEGPDLGGWEGWSRTVTSRHSGPRTIQLMSPQLIPYLPLERIVDLGLHCPARLGQIRCCV